MIKVNIAPELHALTYGASCTWRDFFCKKNFVMSNIFCNFAPKLAKRRRKWRI